MSAFYWLKSDPPRVEFKWQNGVLIDREPVRPGPLREEVTRAMVAIRNRMLGNRG